MLSNFIYLVSREVLEQKQSSLENMGPAISAKARKVFSGL